MRTRATVEEIIPTGSMSLCKNVCAVLACDGTSSPSVGQSDRQVAKSPGYPLQWDEADSSDSASNESECLPQFVSRRQRPNQINDSELRERH
jgi:hypothetical protein